MTSSKVLSFDKKKNDFFCFVLTYSYLCSGMAKNLYIISGCNGAGKTTASNLFRLFMGEVDYWAIFDNSETPRKKIAIGGKNADIEIYYLKLYENMKAYVK